MRKIILASLMLCAAIGLGTPPRSNAADGPTFRGLRFGVDIQKQIPECPPNKENETTTCWIKLPSCEHELGTECSPAGVHFHDALNGTLPGWAEIDQADNKLVEVSFDFPVASFSEVETLFAAKYGRPTISRQQPWQSKGGVRLTAQQRLWHWKGLYVYVKAPADDVDNGVVSVGTQRELHEGQRRDADRLKKGLGDL